MTAAARWSPSRSLPGRGPRPRPAGFYATALWLRATFADMHWDIHQVAADGDIVVVHATASSRHTGPFVLYDERGSVDQVMPPTGRTNSITHTYWFRLADGKVIEHWANRDGLGMATSSAGSRPARDTWPAWRSPRAAHDEPPPDGPGPRW